MSNRRASLRLIPIIAVAVIVCSGVLRSDAQPNGQGIDALMSSLSKGSKIPSAQSKYLSGPVSTVLRLAGQWNQIGSRIRQGVRTAGAPQTRTRLQPTNVTTTGLASRVTGFTQNETSTAWCGTNAVVAFNDSGSFLETIQGALLGAGGLSLTGYALSTNANGRSPSFHDEGTLPPGNDLLAGDPVVACANANTFYVSGLDFTCAGFTGGQCVATQSNVSVSISTDGGATFGTPDIVVSKPYPDHTLDKDWMAVDPGSGRIYVTYTDFDATGSVCGLVDNLFPIERVGIEMVTSGDGGNSWSTPVEISHVCADPSVNPSSALQGTQIAIAPDGSVYVAWEAIGLNGDPTQREIDIAESAGGASLSFSTPVTVAPVSCAGDCFDGILQGAIRIFEFPSLAFGKGSQAGKLFLAWNDGDNPQFDAVIGAYNFTDVKLASSTDGVHWTTPVRVNNNAPSNTDHFQPAVSSDRSGRVAVCFYDRRNDPNNFYIDRYCANSTNGGASFTNTRITTKSFLSVVSQDLLLATGYLGDYDTLASDTLNSTSGFRGAFGNDIAGSPNVQENKF